MTQGLRLFPKNVKNNHSRAGRHQPQRPIQNPDQSELLRDIGCIIRSVFDRLPMCIGDAFCVGLVGGQSKTRMGTNVALRQLQLIA